MFFPFGNNLNNKNNNNNNKNNQNKNQNDDDFNKNNYHHNKKKDQPAVSRWSFVVMFWCHQVMSSRKSLGYLWMDEWMDVDGWTNRWVDFCKWMGGYL